MPEASSVVASSVCKIPMSNRPGDQLGKGPSMVVACRAVWIVDGIGEVQRQVPADNGQLAWDTRCRKGCFHQKSVYQLHVSRSRWVCSQHEAFAGNSIRSGWTSVAVVCVAQFVVVLDVTIVTTALPAIRPALGFGDTGQQWMFTAYALVFGGLLICGGRVADVFGHRRIFLIGLGLFTVASVGCALAWSAAALVAARVVQGAGAALLSPAALAMLTTLTKPGEERRRAVGWWTAVAAGGGASGWVLGGLITEYAGWRWVFAVNVPIGLVALVMGLLVLPAGQRQPGAARLDLGGALTATAGLSLLVYGLTGAGERGLGQPASWVPLLLAAVALVILVRHESRTPDPLLPIGLLRSRAGRRREPDRCGHHCRHVLGDVSVRALRAAGLAGPGGTGVAALSCPQPGCHRRIADRPTAAEGAGRAAHVAGRFHGHRRRDHARCSPCLPKVCQWLSCSRRSRWWARA